MKTIYLSNSLIWEIGLKKEINSMQLNLYHSLENLGHGKLLKSGVKYFIPMKAKEFKINLMKNC